MDQPVPMITGMRLNIMHPETRRELGDLIGDLTIYFDHVPERHIIMEVARVNVDLKTTNLDDFYAGITSGRSTEFMSERIVTITLKLK